MKKYMILLLASLAFTFVACDNDTEPGGTAVEKMCTVYSKLLDSVGQSDFFDVGQGGELSASAQ